MICGNVAGPVCVAGVKPGTVLEATRATSDFLARTISSSGMKSGPFPPGRVYITLKKSKSMRFWDSSEPVLLLPAFLSKRTIQAWAGFHMNLGVRNGVSKTVARVLGRALAG